MKRFYTLLLAAVALFGFAACSQDNDILLNEAMPTMTVYATFEDEATRMELGTNNVTPKWEAGDEIVINNTTFTAANGGRRASFTATSTTLPSGSYTAVYRGEGVTKNCIAAEQQAVAGSFPKQTPAVAAGSAIEEGMTLSFKNVAALLQFQAVEAGDYTFEAVGGELLAADFTVNGDATVTFATSGSSKVTLKDCKAGDTYMVSVAPATLSQGLKVCVGTKELKTGGVGMELERSTIYSLAGLSENETYKNLIWGIVGGHQGWDTSRPTMLDVTNVEGLYVATNIQLGEPGFKFVKGALKDWNDKSSFFGAHAASNGKEYYDFTAEIGANWYNVYDNDLVDNGNEKYPNNIGVSDWTKRYDLYLYFAERGSDYNKLSYTIVEHGEDIVLPGQQQPEMPAAGTQSAFGVVGSFQGWDVANPIAMYSDGERWYVSESIELYRGDEFKFAKNKSWDGSAGFSESAFAEVGTEYDLTTDNGQNIKVAKNGLFKMYINGDATKFCYECVTEYTDLKVDITINNKANWSPLYITLKNGDTTIVDNATVTDNKYAVSGDYIGETLSYVLSNGSKTLEGNVFIAKNGATINLEETVIKLKVQLNTDNAKQWWGDKMMIHVWSTGTSFDTSWPGIAMTSEGDYTWSINVPSELVGKTINYLVHNGNGWQSKDSKVTINAAGNTVTGSSIGVE